MKPKEDWLITMGNNYCEGGLVDDWFEHCHKRMKDRKPGEQRWVFCLHKYWAWLKSQEKK